jgi:hypothetical protein
VPFLYASSVCRLDAATGSHAATILAGLLYTPHTALR